MITRPRWSIWRRRSAQSGQLIQSAQVVKAEYLVRAMEALTVMARSLPDLVVVFDNPPETVGEGLFPFAMLYPLKGAIQPVVANARMAAGTHIIALDIHQSRVVHPSAFTAIRVWPGRVGRMIRENHTLNGTVKAIQWPIDHMAAEMPYGREIHYGIQFQIAVRIY